MKRGRRTTTDEIRRVLFSVIEDLVTLKQVPASWHGLKKELVFLLVAKWRKSASEATIIAKLSRLRVFNRLFQLDMSIPTNHDLGCIVNLPEHDSFIEIEFSEIFQSVHHPVTKILLLLQAEFGLTLNEAMNLDISYAISLETGKLTLDRKTAYNSKERSIPILTKQQREVLNNLEHHFLNERYSLALISNGSGLKVYLAEMRFAGVNLRFPIRNIYARNRFQQLSTDNTHAEAILVLQKEMGFSAKRYVEKAIGQ